jgi:ElaB/YqjD/DUF883 family membrane-anchored ribosome-binding protein
MMEQARGTVKDVVGKAQDAIAEAAGDAAAQMQKRARKAAGKMQRRLQKSYGEAVEGLRDAASSNPAATLAVVAGIGFLLGVMWSRRE